MILRFATIVYLAPLFLESASAANFFEPAGEQYIAHLHAQLVTVSNHDIRIGTPVTGAGVSVEWRGGQPSELLGEGIRAAVSHYYFGSNPGEWRAFVPHFASLSMRDLYRNTNISYYFHDDDFEFDIHLGRGAPLRQLRFATPGARHRLMEDGSLALESRGQSYRLRSPVAYQVDGTGARKPVECHYVLRGVLEVGFRLGTYDHNRELVIDPVLEFLTYLGGSGVDQIQAIGTDSSGNIIVAGSTSSPDFPGGGAPANSTSIFVTKLNSTGTSLLFTTILGSQQMANPYAYVPGVNALAVDSDGSIFVTGQTYAADFPTTPGVWEKSSSGGFVTHLDSTGKIVYSTFLGPTDWGLVAQRMRVRSGIAYLAGDVTAAEFYGTSGAFQQNVDGSSDLFAVAITADGSAPIFATAMGGSGAEVLSDMTLDADGNIVLIGTSSSPDLPLTNNALPYAAPASNTSEAILVRIDPTGSRLISSTWLGTTYANALTTVPDGGIVIAGGSSLPSGLVSGAPHYSANPAGTSGPGYVAKFPLESNQPAWTTDLAGSFTSFSVSSDGVGNLYFIGDPPVVSGGTLGYYAGGSGISKLSADGSVLTYVSPIPGAFSMPDALASAGGIVSIAGSTYGSLLPTTPGVVQAQPVAKTGGPSQSPYSDTSGFVGAFDLSGFNGGNFFVTPSTGNFSLTWRIGEPAPNPVMLPIATEGQVGQLSVTATSGLTATYSTTSSAAVSINVNTDQTAAGTFQESLTIEAPSIPHATLSVPVSLTVQPAVSFDLATNQITIHVRQGESNPPVTVAITPHFGSEFFSFSVTSSVSWISGYVNQANPPGLVVSTSSQPPGTYTGTLTIGLQGLVNPTRVLQVTYIVDPPATIQLSPTALTLHVIRNKPVTPVTVTVTGSVPGVQWAIYSGGYTWMQVKQTTTVTPGQIIIGADSTVAPVGFFTATLIIQGENYQTLYVSVYVDISSGAPVDVIPTSISAEDILGSQLTYQPPTLTMITPNQSLIQITADKPWILPVSAELIQTPYTLPLPLDTTLPEGVYQGNITVTAGSTKVVVPVTWKLYNEPHLVFSQAPISFSYQIGGVLPPAQQLSVVSPTLLQEYFTAGPSGVSGYPDFLTVSPEGGTTPTTLTLTANPTGLAAGTYKENFSIYGSWPYDEANTFIPVTLTITPNPNAPTATVTGVVDGASYLGGAVSPGEVVVLFGSGLGPAKLAQAQLVSNGFPTSLDGWTVFFDKFPAPILYASSSQTAVMVPFEIAGQTTTNVTVSSGATPSVPVTIPVASANPAVFTANSSGSGIAAALNVAADGSTTLNTAATPVAVGGIVTFYVSGLGITTPAMPDGSLAADPLPTLDAPVSILMGGMNAKVLYAGPAPGEIAGLTQINIQVPSGLPSGLIPLLVTSGEAASQPGVTLAVK